MRSLHAPRPRAWVAGLALVLLFSGATANVGSSAADTGSAALTRMQAAIDAFVATGAPGVYVQIRQGDRVVELRAGRPDLGSDKEWTERSRFRVASVTKTFVAAVVMQLVWERRLALVDTVDRWLPGQLPYGDRVTVRQLLNHTSGVPEYQDLNFLLSVLADPARQFSPAQLLARIDGQPLLFEPGTAAQYTNTNFLLLGLIVERVTGNRLDIELKRRILKPLHLSDTSFEVDPSFPAPRVHGYTTLLAPTALADVTRGNPSCAWASGNLVSSGRDVTTFLQALMTGKVVSQPHLDQMRVVDAVATDETGPSFALGLEKQPFSCDNYGKNGSMPGYGITAQSTSDGTRQAMWAMNNVDWLLDPETFGPLFLELRAALGEVLCGSSPN
jgi:D-alanyl-D-alanine carboxypeptidase